MGKRRHNQDKAFITAKEHCQDWGGKVQQRHSTSMVRLPFNYCNLALVEAKQPYSTQDGIVFDLLQIIPYLRKNGNKNPCTGDPLTQQDLVKLTFSRNEQSQLHCPVTFKPFNENSHIVAVKETGNVYSFEAYKELNKDAKWYFDLLTEEPFDPAKLITLQDPKQAPRRFHYKQQTEDEFINKSGQQIRTMEVVNKESELLQQHRKMTGALFHPSKR